MYSFWDFPPVANIGGVTDKQITFLELLVDPPLVNWCIKRKRGLYVRSLCYAREGAGMPGRGLGGRR